MVPWDSIDGMVVGGGGLKGRSREAGKLNRKFKLCKMDGLGGNFPKNIRILASGITPVPIPGSAHVTLRAGACGLRPCIPGRKP